MVTIQSQNFGVEIEMTGVSRGTAASVIANYFGVGGIHFAGGTYQTYEAKDSKGRVWKCMRDGSITPRRRIGGAIVEADDTYRCEVVTPILQYEDITDLQEVIRALVKKGAMANSSCGIHVHVDGANHTPESLCRLLNFATGRQDLFYEALQIGSRADHWCHKINPTLFREMKKNGRASRNDAERIWYSVANDGYDGGVDSSHYNSTRYHGINLHAFFTKGTVEFRLFNGTTHAGRIKAYVQFCLAMSASIVPVHGEVPSQNVKQPFGQFVDAGINPQGVDFILPGFHHLGYGLSQSHRLRVFLERDRKLLHHVVSSQAVVTHPHTLRSLSSPCPTLPLAEPCRCGQGMAHRLPAE